MQQLPLILGFVFMLAVTCTAEAHADGGYAVVTSASNRVAKVSKADLKRIYTGKLKTVNDRAVVVVIEKAPHPAFGELAEHVFGVSAKTLVTKIKQEVFKGEMPKPLTASRDDEVLTLLREHEAAIGVVSAETAKHLPSGVIRVEVD